MWLVFGVFLTFSFIFTTGQASGWCGGLGGSLSVSSFYGNLLRKYHLLIKETLISFIEFRSKYSWYEGKWENKAYLVSCFLFSSHHHLSANWGMHIYHTLLWKGRWKCGGKMIIWKIDRACYIIIMNVMIFFLLFNR